MLDVVKDFRPYRDYSGFDIYDCPDCGCRAVDRDSGILDVLFSPRTMAFDFNQRTHAEARRHFQSGRVKELRRALARDTGFGYVLEHIDRASSDARILVVGCSLVLLCHKLRTLTAQQGHRGKRRAILRAIQ